VKEIKKSKYLPITEICTFWESATKLGGKLNGISVDVCSFSITGMLKCMGVPSATTIRSLITLSPDRTDWAFTATLATPMMLATTGIKTDSAWPASIC
jgi:hypothetical protein